MQPIISSYFHKNDFIDTIKKVVPEVFNISIEEHDIIEYSLYDHFNELKDEIWFYLEYPYVDKVYRNSYYLYFSSKHKDYDRNCIRLSIFNTEINENDFRDLKKIQELQNKYLGYIILRPTSSCLIGRSMVSPKALKKDNLLCCLVSDSNLINGVILKISAFPHSSQDQETITCAETTIWSIMEYFGNKYSNYIPVLPFNIMNVLDKLSTERLMPSSGLTATQISYALKEFGFGPKIYSSPDYNNNELKKIFNYYIESGIPLIAALENNKIGHAIIFCGHEEIDVNKVDSCPLSYQLIKPNGDKIIIYDTADIEKKYVVIDDNYCPYRITTFENPTAYYTDPDFFNCKIKSIIVPLYPKIYLEAYKARKLVDLIVSSDKIGIDTDSILIRFFLTSSRSFKRSITLNTSFDEDYKELILGSSMPKFIWVAELSSKGLYKQNKAFGFIIIDATGSDSTDSIVLIAYSDKIITFIKNQYQIYERKFCKLYDIYRNNLKGGWNAWQT